MWTVVQVTTYETGQGQVVKRNYTMEAGSLEVALVDVVDRVVDAWDSLKEVPPEPFLGVLQVALSVTCTPSSTQAVTRDMEAARILQKIQASLASSLSSSATSRKDGTKGTTNGSSPS